MAAVFLRAKIIGKKMQKRVLRIKMKKVSAFREESVMEIGREINNNDMGKLYQFLVI